MDLSIRSAGFDDLSPAAAMEVRAWRESYQGLLGPSIFDDLASDVHGIASRWAELMQQGHAFWLVVDGDDDGRIVGVCHAGPARDEDAPLPLELDTLYLLEDAKGTGIGSQLLSAAIDDNDAYLWVLRGNQRAINFYLKEGFVADGAERDMPHMRGAVEQRMVRHASSAAVEA